MTITTSTVSPASETGRTRRGLRVRRIATAVAMAAAALGGSVVTAAPASAATAASFCFTFANPPSHTSYANRPVYLYQELPHGWEVVRSGYTGSNGCGSFYNLSAPYRYQVRAYLSTSYQTWDGWSAVAPGDGRGYYLGNNAVFRTR